MKEKNIFVIGGKSSKSSLLNGLLGFEQNTRFKLKSTVDVDRQPFQKNKSNSDQDEYVDYVFYDTPSLDQNIDYLTLSNVDTVCIIIEYMYNLVQENREISSILYLIDSNKMFTEKDFYYYQLFYKYIGNNKIPFICVLSKYDEIKPVENNSKILKSNVLDPITQYGMVFNDRVLTSFPNKKVEGDQQVQSRDGLWNAIENLESPIPYYETAGERFKSIFGDLNEETYKRNLLNHFIKMGRSNLDINSSIFDKCFAIYKKNKKQINS